MSEVSLKIEIANKEYPLKVTKEDAETIEKAASLIKGKIAEFDKAYTVPDKKDVLAMVFLQTVSEYMKQDQKKTEEISRLQGLLDELNDMIKQHQQKVGQ